MTHRYFTSPYSACDIEEAATPVPQELISRAPLIGGALSAKKIFTSNRTLEIVQKNEGKPTKADLKLMLIGDAIATSPPVGDDMAFTHSVLCQVGLPRSKVAGREFMRHSGSAWLSVQAGFLDEGNGPILQPIPYGPMPRIALSWVSSFAKRHSTPEIQIGDSAAHFLRLLGLDDQGGRYITLREQMLALAACRLQLGFKGRTFNEHPIEQFDAWQTTPNRNGRMRWPGTLVLSDSFYREILEHAVPLDNRALRGLRGSALALDVYTWLAHRLYRIQARPVMLYWKAIREQFAQEYIGKNAHGDFKTNFLASLEKVKTVYPQAAVKNVRGGLLLFSSPPPVPFRK